ncbi:hypothetical protein [Collimonas sp. PA-H2]|nr:hypothetical protein [Collimonas sp. PA-H2]
MRTLIVVIAGKTMKAPLCTSLQIFGGNAGLPRIDMQAVAGKRRINAFI